MGVVPFESYGITLFNVHFSATYHIIAKCGVTKRLSTGWPVSHEAHVPVRIFRSFPRNFLIKWLEMVRTTVSPSIQPSVRPSKPWMSFPTNCNTFRIEGGVLSYLHGSAHRGQRCETTNITEVNRDGIECFCFNPFSLLQLLGYRSAKENIHVSIHTTS